MPLVEICIFCSGLFEDGDLGVGVFPERKEILIGRFRFGLITPKCVSSTQLQVRHCADGIADYDPAVIENFLEFPGGFGALVCGQIRKATDIGRVEITGAQKEFRTACGGTPEFIRNRGLEQFESL